VLVENFFMLNVPHRVFVVWLDNRHRYVDGWRREVVSPWGPNGAWLYMGYTAIPTVSAEPNLRPHSMQASATPVPISPDHFSF
jgi:hypothetical protein